MRVVVVGTGYVGLVTGTCLAEMGNEVVCQDIDPKKVAMLQGGEVPIYEPGLTELVERNVRQGRLSFTTNLVAALNGKTGPAEVCFIAVGTPPDEDGSADRRYVLGAARAIGEHMQAPLVVAVKSTVPVGTCEEVERSVREGLASRNSTLAFEVVSNPEFLKEGKAVEDFSRPDRIVVGTTGERGRRLMEQLYGHFLRNGHPLLFMDLRSAEMTKYAANAMLATRISLMNEFALICEELGADIMEVRRGIGTDARIGMSFLYAGLGYGGSCFPKDVRALSRMAADAKIPADILEAVHKVNRNQNTLLADRALAFFGGNLRGKRLALWGLAFKPGTDDVREAPALATLERLLEAGALISAYDPEAIGTTQKALGPRDGLAYAPDPYAALEGADALLIATEWSLFRQPDFTKMAKIMKSKVIFDGRNQYERDTVEQHGFAYIGIGRAWATVSRQIAVSRHTK